MLKRKLFVYVLVVMLIALTVTALVSCDLFGGDDNSVDSPSDNSDAYKIILHPLGGSITGEDKGFVLEGDVYVKVLTSSNFNRDSIGILPEVGHSKFYLSYWCTDEALEQQLDWEKLDAGEYQFGKEMHLYAKWICLCGVDNNRDHVCDNCGKVSECWTSNPNGHKCDYCFKLLTDCIDADFNHFCDMCGGFLGGACLDNNEDHSCDYCGISLSDCIDVDKNNYCDVCNMYLDEDYSLIFKLKENREYEVVGYIGTPVDVVVPNKYKGMAVTSIGEGAFKECRTLENLTLPDCLVEIKDEAFCWCYALKDIYWGKGLVTIGNDAFRNDFNIKSILLPDTVEYIGDGAFDFCHEANKVTLGNSLKVIGKDSFNDCFNLYSITIPETTTSIGDRAFFGCYKLVEIYNLSSLNIVAGSDDFGYIGDFAIDVHNSLDVQSKMVVDEDGYVIYPSENGNELIGYLGDEKDLVLPSNIQRVHEGAFMWEGLTSVQFSEGIESFGFWSFYECDLTSVVLPKSTKYVMDASFYETETIEEFIIPDSVEYIDEPMSQMPNLKFNVKDNVNYLGNESNPYLYAVSLVDNNVTSVVIVDECRFIDSSAFFYAENLQELTLGSGITQIFGGLIAHNTNLSTVTFKDPTTWYSSDSGTSLTSFINKTGTIVDFTNDLDNVKILKEYNVFYFKTGCILCKDENSDHKCDVCEEIFIGNDVGNLCPTYDLKNVYGEGTTNVESLRGKVVVINFWFSTCASCLAELPYFNQLANEYDGQVEVVLVHASFDTETTAPYLEKNYPNSKMIAVFDEAVPNRDDYYYKKLGGKGTYPLTVILDEDGIITHSIKKSISAYAELEGYVKDALGE